MGWRPKGPLIYEEVNKAIKFVVMNMQQEICSDLIKGERGKGRFTKLAPVKVMKASGELDRVCETLYHSLAMVRCQPKILPANHQITFLLIRHTHQFSHTGLDGTLSRFYAKGYWTVRGRHVARAVKN